MKKLKVIRIISIITKTRQFNIHIVIYLHKVFRIIPAINNCFIIIIFFFLLSSFLLIYSNDSIFTFVFGESKELTAWVTFSSLDFSEDSPVPPSSKVA